MKILLSALFCSLLALPAFGQMHPLQMPMVQATGEGLVKIDPDQVTVQFGVITWAEDPETARAENAQAAARVLNALRALGIPEEGIQLQVLRLSPRYEHDERTNERTRVGYEAVRQVEVVLNELDKLSEVIARVVAEGANQLSGIRYGLQEQTLEKARHAALQEAARQAREQAALLVSALGAKLGKLQKIVQRSYSDPRPFAYRGARMMAEMAVASKGVPDAFAPGELKVQAEVLVVFGLR